jgi:Rap/ran-GAP
LQSGTKYSIYRPSLTSPPRHQVPLTTGLDADAFYASSYTGVLPEDVLQDLYSPLALASVPGSLPETPLLLPNDDMVQRDLSTFDRNSTVDGYRIGVIYIGEGQTDEVEILANTNGSAAYAEFISQLGTLVRLKGATMNTQDLDRVADVDGPYAYCWRDRATEVVFHITTMMPTDLENDAQCINKKRHIGNDFVNIVWNESGQDFRFDTFPSAFNYVYIVITPETRAGLVADEANGRAADDDDDDAAAPEARAGGGAAMADALFRVLVLSAPSFPAVSPASEAKLLSGRALGAFVRLVALNGAFFSRVWAVREQGGEHVSSWRSRLLDIRRMRDKYGSREKVVGGAAPEKAGGGGGSNRASGAWGGGGGVAGDRSSMSSAAAARQQRASLSFGLGGAEPGYF